MDYTDDNIKNVDNTEAAVQQDAPRRRPLWRTWWAVVTLLAVLLTAVAWVSMIYNEYLSFYSSLVSMVVSLIAVVGLKRGLMRDIAITCLIAAAVLLLVYGIFFFGVNWAINHI